MTSKKEEMIKKAIQEKISLVLGYFMGLACIQITAS